ncbi:MAG: type II secretion system protein [Planctomycetota bacterium]
MFRRQTESVAQSSGLRRKPEACATKGFTLIEMLTVIVILLFLITFFGRKFLLISQAARVKSTQQLINRIGIALARYQADCRDLPPDTGYGQQLSSKRVGDVVTYHSGSLWYYLAQPIVVRRKDTTIIRTLGPYISYRFDPTGNTELLPYDDPIYGKSYYVVDSWRNPIGYVGSPKRVVHNRGFCDLYSAGPDGVTASNDNIAIPGVTGPYNCYDTDGDVSEMGPAAMNGCLTVTRIDAQPNEVLDDINNWDPQQ